MSKDGAFNANDGWLNRTATPQQVLADESGPFNWFQWVELDAGSSLPIIDPLLLRPVGMGYDSASQSRMFSQLQDARNYHIPAPAIESMPRSSNQPQPFRATWMAPPVETPISDPERKYKCRECGNGFKTTSGLRHHSYTHSKERPFVCNFEDCQKSYTTNNRL
ncbi:hypothetical protein HDU81_003059 [Chytriomyces hyalinus]|nr:hypothetical protein HDU81_003059 [Chytriomyces hyalinus]